MFMVVEKHSRCIVVIQVTVFPFLYFHIATISKSTLQMIGKVDNVGGIKGHYLCSSDIIINLVVRNALRYRIYYMFIAECVMFSILALN